MKIRIIPNQTNEHIDQYIAHCFDPADIEKGNVTRKFLADIPTIENRAGFATIAIPAVKPASSYLYSSQSPSTPSPFESLKTPLTPALIEAEAYKEPTPPHQIRELAIYAHTLDGYLLLISDEDAAGLFNHPVKREWKFVFPDKKIARHFALSFPSLENFGQTDQEEHANFVYYETVS